MSKIWESLKINPDLQRNNMIMWVHLSMFSCYSFSWVGCMIFSMLMFETTWKYSYSCFCACGFLRAISELGTNLIFLKLAYQFTFSPAGYAQSENLTSTASSTFMGLSGSFGSFLGSFVNTGPTEDDVDRYIEN